MQRARRIAARLILALLAWAPAAAWSQDYPARPIRLIITTPAGGLVDVMGRLFADELSSRLGQPIVIDNRPGGMTQVGADALNRAAPDGYTLMIATSESAMLPFLKKSYRHDPIKDFTPIALLTSSWTVFAVHPSVPARTLPELVSYAKANPGKLRYGSGGVGGALHIAVEMLKLSTGADIVHVPYRSGAQAATDTISGQIDMVSMGLASARVAEGGKLRVLARHPLFAEVPTTAEAGLPEVRMETWFGLSAPPNLPDAIVARLARETEAVARQQSFADKLAKIGCAVAFLPRGEFAAFIAQESRKWERLIPAMGIPIID
jgi:tripartite-type tricarboxylate transporter receptor subunit TctC